MGAHFGRLLGIAVLAGFMYVPTAHADPHFSIHVGIGAPVVPVAPVAPVVVAPAVRPGYIWQPGHYVYARFGYTWVPGVWVPAPRAYGYRTRDWRRWR